MPVPILKIIITLVTNMATMITMTKTSFFASIYASYPTVESFINRTTIKHNQIITKVESNYWNRTYKFGIWVPTDVDEFLNIDR